LRGVEEARSDEGPEKSAGARDEDVLDGRLPGLVLGGEGHSGRCMLETRVLIWVDDSVKVVSSGLINVCDTSYRNEYVRLD
jgi:hypothetical protein